MPRAVVILLGTLGDAQHQAEPPVMRKKALIAGFPSHLPSCAKAETGLKNLGKASSVC